MYLPLLDERLSANEPGEMFERLESAAAEAKAAAVALGGRLFKNATG